MSTLEICNTLSNEYIQLPPLADDCYLFLWRVAAMQADALLVCEEWGFTPKTELVWIKCTVNGARHFGMGHHLRAEHETCIVATRGKPKPKNRSTRSTFMAPVGKHSQKPDAFYDLVESFCDGPYGELYARKVRPGWQQWGNELGSIK
jgi:N6-adenosine-specific RNA methylase IME4